LVVLRPLASTEIAERQSAISEGRAWESCGTQLRAEPRTTRGRFRGEGVSVQGTNVRAKRRYPGWVRACASLVERDPAVRHRRAAGTGKMQSPAARALAAANRAHARRRLLHVAHRQCRGSCCFGAAPRRDGRAGRILLDAQQHRLLDPGNRRARTRTRKHRGSAVKSFRVAGGASSAISGIQAPQPADCTTSRSTPTAKAKVSGGRQSRRLSTSTRPSALFGISVSWRFRTVVRSVERLRSRLGPASSIPPREG